jgi:hypothetical protein
MTKGTIWRAGTNAAVCAVLGAGVGVAASAASPLHSNASSRESRRSAKTASAVSWGGWFAVHRHLGIERVTSPKRSMDHLTIREGTSSVPYKTITMAIPRGATDGRVGNSAALSALKTGDVVVVRHSSDGTAVLAGASGTTGWSTGSGPGDGWGGYGPPSGGWGGYDPTGC